jgi:hypothetical protein
MYVEYRVINAAIMAPFMWMRKRVLHNCNTTIHISNVQYFYINNNLET